MSNERVAVRWVRGTEPEAKALLDVARSDYSRFPWCDLCIINLADDGQAWVGIFNGGDWWRFVCRDCIREMGAAMEGAASG